MQMKAGSDHISKRHSDRFYTALIIIAYYLTIGALILGSLFPENRIWGVNAWAYFPQIWKLFLFSVGIFLPLIILLLRNRKGVSFSARFQNFLESKNNYLWWSVLLVSVMAALFYFFRAKTHFLGDGYLNLSSIASAQPVVKNTSYLEVQAHVWLKELMGGDSETSALLNFQVISILSGIILIIAVSLLARKLFDRRVDSAIFTLGIVSSGYMLLYFGYVEYYSLFVLSVAIYTIAGLLIINGKLNKWIIISLFLLTVFLHIFGIILLPSTLFVLFSGTTLERLLERISNKTKWLLVFLSGIALVIVFLYFYSNSYRFRFAFVPVFADRFTSEGYTLFSLKHIADFLNLLIVLLPGLLVFWALTPHLALRNSFRQKPYQYLSILILSIFGALFLINPRLGMPRDWDLFSFSGVPLAVFVYYIILQRNQNTWKYVAIGLIIALGLFSLIPRAIRQNTPNLAVEEFRTCAALDRAKNRVGRKVLVDYCIKSGDSLIARFETSQWLKDFPEHDVVTKVDSLGRANKSREAIQYAKQTIIKNPIYPSSYFAVGTEYLVLHNIDSAIQYLAIADGMNPNNPDFLCALGAAYTAKREFNKAEDALLNAITTDDLSLDPYLALLQLYQSSSQSKKYYSLLSRTAQRSDAPPEVLVEMGKNLINEGKLESGKDLIEKAIAKGLDSATIRSLEVIYPQLKR